MGRGCEPKEKEERQFGNLHTPAIVKQWKKTRDAVMYGKGIHVHWCRLS